MRIKFSNIDAEFYVSKTDAPKVTPYKWRFVSTCNTTGGKILTNAIITSMKVGEKEYRYPTIKQVAPSFKYITPLHDLQRLYFARIKKCVRKNPYRGVTPQGYFTKEGKFKVCGYTANIMSSYKFHYLGYDKDPVKMAKKYDTAARKLHGVYAVTNF